MLKSSLTPDLIWAQAVPKCCISFGEENITSITMSILLLIFKKTCFEHINTCKKDLYTLPCATSGMAPQVWRCGDTWRALGNVVLSRCARASNLCSNWSRRLKALAQRGKTTLPNSLHMFPCH